MEKLIIHGGHELHGRVKISGASGVSADYGPHGEYFKDRVSPNEKLCGYYSKEHCDQFV